MALNFRTFVDGIQILPKTTSTASIAGDLDFDTTANKLNLHNGIISSPIVTEASGGTLTGKTLSGASNTFTNIGYSSLILTGTILNSDLAGSIDLTTKVAGLLPLANGGTGQTTKAPAFDALSPMTTLGDLILGGAAGTGTRLPIGTNGFVLGSNGTTAVWTASGAGDMLLSAVQTVTGAKTFNDGTLKLAGSTSGAATLKAPAVAATNTYTLPSSSGTIVGTGDTGTVTVAMLAAAAQHPIGSVIAYAGSSAPTGWLLCDGTAISRATFASLFAIIGTTYGVGDGSTTFNTPNTSGIFIGGTGTQTISGIAQTIDAIGTVANDQTQGHRHSISDPGHSHTPSLGGSFVTTQSGGAANGVGVAGNANSPATTTEFTGVTVGNSTTDTVNGTPRTGSTTKPASIAMNYIIKT